MNKYLIICVLFLLAFCSCEKKQNILVSSPDNYITFQIQNTLEKIQYQVLYNGKEVILPSFMGLELSGGQSLGENMEMESYSILEHDNLWNHSKKINVELSFLDPEINYSATCFSDNLDLKTLTNVEIKEKQLNSKTNLNISLSVNQGHAVIITPRNLK